MAMEVENRKNRMPKRIAKKWYRVLSNPRYTPWVLTALLFFLVVSFGVNGILYNKQQSTAGQITQLKRDKIIADKAAIKVCVQSLPSRTKLIKEIISGYEQDAENARDAYLITPVNDPIRAVRFNSWHTKLNIANALKEFLPISCSPTTKKPKRPT